MTNMIFNSDILEREEEIKEYALAVYGEDNGWKDYDDIPKSEIYDIFRAQNDIEWEIAYDTLDDFIGCKECFILIGNIKRWNGEVNHNVLFHSLYEIEKIFYGDEIKIYDKNGHLYIETKHHDGTNVYEIKKVTEQGIKYFDNWYKNWDDKRSEDYIYNMIMKRYSRLPHYYGIQYMN